jgi:hypothetical protein
MPELKRIDWSNRATWPYGGADHTFVGEALEIVGRHFYEAEWKGDEFWRGYLDMQFQPDNGTLADARSYGRLTAASLLRHFRPDIAPKSPEALTDELWAAAWALFPHYVTARREAGARLYRAKVKLRELCASGKLVAAYRWEHSGDHSKIDKERWNPEKYLEWLKNGYVYFSDVGSSYGGSGSEKHYLFIENEGLEALKMPSVSGTDAFSDRAYQSAYLRFLLFAAGKLDVRPDDTRTAKELRCQIEDLGKAYNGPRITPNLAKSMATILREPEAGLGKADPNRKKSSDGTAA